MTRSFDPEFDILYADEVARAGDDPRRLRRHYASGHLIRIRRGAYVVTPLWEAADERQRHIARVLAAAHDAVRPYVAAGISAAAVWDAPVFIPFGAVVEIVDGYRGGGRSEPGVRRATAAAEFAYPVRRMGIDVTDVARTAIDLATRSTFPAALAAMDWAISAANPDATSVAVVRDRLREMGARPGARTAWRAAESAVSNSGSGGESFGRGVIHDLGFVDPVTQLELRDAEGAMYADYAWPDVKVLVEFDGFVKYRDPRFNHGDPLEKLRREREREARLRALGWTVVRITWADLQDPPRLARLLATVGVPRRQLWVRREK
ncbi:type IV toxin-antitoxin system AbiEi family antitoxin domain-containing protein [Protaetiibacter larvae]|uniref:AbiEi antitoxin N-terminal domain-containing protein n=1 Tax=Protaetiibacter larvae TaxID=2592654 RepID=A0A5C1Y8M3_9MICO|nr:type IV toxin-antitoxin system AbiEi family antitoxin domain-containing protein [Protaetiibacter larvae]QEO09292.1 hypothetical protein FLP23_04260 [Protaetiibacter larvae]